MQDSLPAGGLRLYREGVEPSGSLRKVSGYIPFSFPGLLLSQGWSMPSRRSPAPRPYSPISRAIPTGSPSRTGACSPSKRPVSPSATRIYRRDGVDRQQVMTLGTDEFIRRFLLHVLPRGFHRIRHYGLLASSARKASLARARACRARECEHARCASRDCGGHMIIIETFERWRQPRAPPHCTQSTGRHSP